MVNKVSVSARMALFGAKHSKSDTGTTVYLGGERHASLLGPPRAD